MTQFTPPPPPDQPYAVVAVDRPWSCLAIWALVLAFIPCSAPIALILGVCAIFVTVGGARRGLVLAIVSLPLAVVTGGCLTGLVYIGLDFNANMAKAKKAVEAGLVSSSVDGAAVLADLREYTTDDLTATATAADVETWAKLVISKHGTFRESILNRPPMYQSTADGQGVIFSFPCKFVNGEANLTLHFARNPGEYLVMKLNDLEVDGISLRDVAAKHAAHPEPEPPEDESTGQEEQPEETPEGEGS